MNAAAARDAELMKAVEAGAARDEQILAAVEAGAQRDAGLRQQIRGLGDSLRRKTKKESVRQLKESQLAQFEVVLDYVEDKPFARGGEGEVFMGEYQGDSVVLKKISLVGMRGARPDAPSWGGSTGGTTAQGSTKSMGSGWWSRRS